MIAVESQQQLAGGLVSGLVSPAVGEICTVGHGSFVGFGASSMAVCVFAIRCISVAAGRDFDHAAFWSWAYWSGGLIRDFPVT